MDTLGEFEIKPIALILAVIGGGIALFTATGGFSSWPEGLEPGWAMKFLITMAGAAAGFIWGSMMGD